MSDNKTKVIKIILIILFIGLVSFISFNLGKNSDLNEVLCVSKTENTLVSDLPLDEFEETESTEESNDAVEPNEEEKIPRNLEDTLYMGMSIHVEGWKETNNTIKYKNHAAEIDEFAAIFEEYNMPLTLELRPDEFVVGSINAEDSDFILELAERGHDIQVHADLGPKFSVLKPFIQTLKEYKGIINSVGIEVNGVSGVCAELDWVTAVKKSGFKFVTGVVEYCMKSLEELPEGYEDIADCDNPVLCHARPMASNLDFSMHPLRPISATNWITDGGAKDMPVIFIGGNLGEIKCLSEGEYGKCDFDIDDVDIIKTRIDEALENLDPARINTLNMTISIGKSPDENFIRELLDLIKTYVNEGNVEWIKMSEQYERFLEWEK